MTKRDRTIAALKYINSIEKIRLKYLKKRKRQVKNSTWNIYFVYVAVINKFVPSFKLIDYMYNVYEMRSLIKSDTTCVLSKKHRKLINLISYYYHQKDYDFLFFIMEDMIKRSEILFSKKKNYEP